MDKELTRRSFLQGSVLLGAAAAAATGLGSLSGCSPDDKKKGAAGMLATPSGISYAVHEADVIVVGGGMAGLNAARMARNGGATVILVDKGPAGHSGNSGVMWGQTFVTTEGVNDDGSTGTRFLAVDCMGILDQDQAKNVSMAQIEGQSREAVEGAGNMFQRGDDGKVIGIDAKDNVTVTHNAIYRQTAQMLIKQGIPVFEHTMMLDILLDEAGAAAGIVAVNIADGSAHVFRGKKTILCTGGYHWAAKSAGSPESTGDGHFALLKRGYAFKDMEFPQFDFCSVQPFGSRPDKERDQVQIAVTLPLNGDIHHRMVNADKQNYTEYFFTDPSVRSIAAFQGCLITTAKELYQGNGAVGDGSGNAIYFNMDDLDKEPNSQSYASYKGRVKYITENMGMELPQYLESMASEYSSAGVPVQDPETCEHQISGLYTVFVALSAMSSMWNWSQSYLAGKDACAQAMMTDGLPAFSPEDVDASLSKAYKRLTDDVDGGIRASEVFRRIQRAFYIGQDFMKNEGGINAMLKELERIQREDLPKMVCEDKSRVFNRDWKHALEAEPMLYCSLATAHASLARKESRSPFFRTDYPKMDNKNFLCYLWVSIAEDGSWKVEKGDIVDTVMPRDELEQVLDDSDPKYDISVPNIY